MQTGVGVAGGGVAGAEAAALAKPRAAEGRPSAGHGVSVVRVRPCSRGVIPT